MEGADPTLSPQEQEMLTYLENLQANNPAEYELLVKEMQEKSGKAGGGKAGGSGGEQVTPTPGFVAKTRSATNKGAKVFINVCQSEHVDKPAPVPSAENAEEVQMRIPLSLGPPREDLDKGGDVCTVYDVVFHPDAVAGALAEEEFRSFVMQLTLHQIQQKFQDELSHEITFPKVRGNYKGIAPLPQFMRKKGTPPPPPPGSQEALEAEAAKAAEEASSAKKPLVEELAPLPNEALPAPSYSVEERHLGRGASAAAAAAASSTSDAPAADAPPADGLCFKCHLPTVEDAEAIELSCHAEGLELLVPTLYALSLELPHPVALPAVSVRFESKRRVLSVIFRLDKAALTTALEEGGGAAGRTAAETPTGGDAHDSAQLGFTDNWQGRLEREREARQNARRKRAEGQKQLQRQQKAEAAAETAADDGSPAEAPPPPPPPPPKPKGPPPPPPLMGLTNSIMFELEELFS